MDLTGLDEILQNSGNFVPTNGDATTTFSSVLSEFHPTEEDSGNAASSPEYAFATEYPYDDEMENESNLTTDEDDDLQSHDATTQSLDRTNPFAVHSNDMSKSNPLYDGHDEKSTQNTLFVNNEVLHQSPVSGNLHSQPPSSMQPSNPLEQMARVAVSQRQYLKPESTPTKRTTKDRSNKQQSLPRKSTAAGSKKKRKLGDPKQEHISMQTHTATFVEMNESEMEKELKPEGIKKLNFHHHEPHSRNMNCRLFDEKLEEISIWSFDVEADKGFSYSILDESFVCQKKNHFQVSVSISLNGVPKFVQIEDSVRPISELFVAIWGLKDEEPPSTVGIEQSHVDRSKRPFEPVPVSIDLSGQCNATFSRLHFSETTGNNMRKKGKPNPDQRFFVLLIEFHAVVDDTIATIHCEKSERIIVRASNPGQFDGEIDMKWVKGKVPDSIVHHGPVGVNTDKPMGALAVNGNMAVTGSIMHPSDRRVKQDLVPTNTQQQLQNVADLKLYKYMLVEDWSTHTGRQGADRYETGVIAQDLQKVMPDAVRNTGQSFKFDNNDDVEDLLVVDMDRVFMENVGAVQELCKMTDNLDTRIRELEELNSQMQSGTYRRRKKHHRRKTNDVNDSLLKPEGELFGEDAAPFPWLKTLMYIFVAMIIFSLLAVTIILLTEREASKDDPPTPSPDPSSSSSNPNGTNRHARDIEVFAHSATHQIFTRFISGF